MPTIQVSAGVLTQGSQILICQRRAEDPHPFKWEFPGGKVQEGEDGETCLWRELQEELCVDATIGVELHSATHTYANGRTVALRFFHVPVFRGELINTQFQALAWVEAAQLTQYEFLEGDLDFVTALARGEWAHVFRAERS